jgi:hypothetical protein
MTEEFCDPCFRDDVQAKATTLCTDCEEFLCDDCTTGATSGPGSAFPSAAPEFIPGF